MTFAAGQKQPILEIDVSKVLSGMNLKYEEFVDLCIMMGCDYMGTIKGVAYMYLICKVNEYTTEIPVDIRPNVRYYY